MALIFSTNPRINANPFPHTIHNFKSNHSWRSGRDPHSHFPFPLPAATGWSLRRRLVVYSSQREDSVQSNLEEAQVDNLGIKAALSMLRFYKQEISPLLPNSCRYVPTCSEYSMIAYKKYGVVKGTILTAWRLCRCNPLGGSGFDPPRWFDEPTPPEQ